MKIETKLILNNIKKNKKRTIFTTISIILCAILILTTMIIISSIRSGITENIETKYNDYHFIIKNIEIYNINKLRDKEYINNIYIQKDDDAELEELEKAEDSLINSENTLNVFIKYNNIKKACAYSNDILKTLNLSYNDAKNRCEFNKKLLTVYGLIDTDITTDANLSPICQTRVNYSYVLDIMIIVILVAFSILSIIILYNAFLITINERKKEYAILNSIGATEGQILKMIFLEAVMIGIIGIIIGSLISILGANIILKILNNILVPTAYNFRLIFDNKYVIISIITIIFNIFISALIPSVKASTTSIIQGIRNNKQIKNKKRNNILEKILPIEGKLALKNIKRNRNKYRVITILLVICMTAYIIVNTYVNYEKEIAEIVNEHNVDAELTLNSSLNIDYKSILDNYETETENRIEYLEYKKIGSFVLVEPEDSIMTNQLVTTYADNKKSISILLIGLDDKTYNNYIKKVNANYGDFIIYNNMTIHEEREGNILYTYEPVFKQGYDLKLSLTATSYNYEKSVSEYEIIDNENLNGNFILTDKLIEGYSEIKSLNYGKPTIFTNMDTYNKIEEKFNNYKLQNRNSVLKWLWTDKDEIYIKVKCDNIIEFSNYIENINKKQNIEINVKYYSLENKEKIIYINIIKLILRIIILAVIIIGVISTINIINASLYERKQEFKILDSIGATRENISKILIYECIYMFIKATIISIVLSIPILYKIIKYMENIITLNKILIPFGNICLFFILLFVISLFITLYATRFIKKE